MQTTGQRSRAREGEERDAQTRGLYSAAKEMSSSDARQINMYLLLPTHEQQVRQPCEKSKNALFSPIKKLQRQTGSFLPHFNRKLPDDFKAGEKKEEEEQEENNNKPNNHSQRFGMEALHNVRFTGPKRAHAKQWK